MTRRIYAIDSVDLAIQKSLPPNLLIDVEGRTATTGWSNIHLSPFHYVMPPVDGVQDYDVLGTPPASGTIVAQVLAKVRTNTVLPQIDIENYWGEGLPLRGVRCHGQSNAKLQLFEPVPGMGPVSELDDPQADVSPALSFERDIRPLFRPADIGVMISVRNLDLSAHADVSEHAELIHQRLADGSMPCDGGWPGSDIDLFRRWIDEGKQP